jgi:hypothetical protein
MNIVIHCVFDENVTQGYCGTTENYAAYMRNVANKLANSPEKLTFMRHPPGDGNLSVAHMLGLRHVLDNIVVDAINVIADSDTIMLKRGWDDDVRRICETCSCVGTTYVPFDQPGSRQGKIKTYVSHPNFCWIALAAGIDWKSFDPARNDMIPVTTQGMADLTGLNIGDVWLQDTAFKFPEFLNALNKQFINLERVYDKRIVLTSSCDDWHDEFHLNGEPFVAHQNRGSRYVFRSQPHSAPFYDACDAWLAKCTT